MELSEKDIAKFWSKVEKGESAECWLWTGHVDTSGRAKIFLNSSQWTASHVAWWLEHGEAVPKGMMLACECGNRLCVNPGHRSVRSRGSGQQSRRQPSKPKKPVTTASRMSVSVLATLCGFQAVSVGRNRYRIVKRGDN